MKIVAHVARTLAGPVLLAVKVVEDSVSNYDPEFMVAARTAEYVQYDLSTVVAAPVGTTMDEMLQIAMARMSLVNKALAA